MRRRPVSSSVIASIGYDEDTAVLEIEFHSGEVYRYFVVPASVHERMLGASSIGRFFLEHVRDRYPTERV